MAELIAQGRNPNDQWRRELPENKPVVVGREQVEWAVPWDLFISRRHAEVVWHDGRLELVRRGNGHGQSRALPRTGWTWQATIEREGGDKPALVSEWLVRYYQ